MEHPNGPESRRKRMRLTEESILGHLLEALGKTRREEVSLGALATVGGRWEKRSFQGWE